MYYIQLTVLYNSKFNYYCVAEYCVLAHAEFTLLYYKKSAVNG